MNATEETALAFYEEARSRFSLRKYNVQYDGERRLVNVTIRQWGTSLDYATVVFAPDRIVVDCYRLNRRYQECFAYELPWVDEVLDLIARHMTNRIERSEYK